MSKKQDWDEDKRKQSNRVNYGYKRRLWSKYFMKVCIKAWQNVINPLTEKIHDEFGQKALDALLYGPVWNVEKIHT